MILFVCCRSTTAMSLESLRQINDYSIPSSSSSSSALSTVLLNGQQNQHSLHHITQHQNQNYKSQNPFNSYEYQNNQNGRLRRNFVESGKVTLNVDYTDDAIIPKRNIDDRFYHSSQKFNLINFNTNNNNNNNNFKDTNSNNYNNNQNNNNRNEDTLSDRTNENIRSDNLRTAPYAYSHTRSSLPTTTAPQPPQLQSQSYNFHKQNEYNQKNEKESLQRQQYEQHISEQYNQRMREKRERHEAYRKNDEIMLENNQHHLHHHSGVQASQTQLPIDVSSMVESSQYKTFSHHQSLSSQLSSPSYSPLSHLQTLKQTEEGNNLILNPNRNRRSSNRRLQRRRRKSYCSIRDPQSLAFIAPIVVKAKVKSSSSNHTSTVSYFSVTFEIIEEIKVKQLIPQQIRLQFVWRKRTKPECDIYPVKFKSIGNISEAMKENRYYYLFLKQEERIENFTILGQPYKDPIKNKSKSASLYMQIRAAVGNGYGEFHFIYLFENHFIFYFVVNVSAHR